MMWTKDWLLLWTQAQIDLDLLPGAPRDNVRTMDLVRNLADSITTGVGFTVDLPSDHLDGKAPMRDTAVWVQRGTGSPGKGNIIRYCYYEKPTTSPLFFHAHGAHAWRTKLTTLFMEVVRRMANCDRFTTTTVMSDILAKFTTKIRDSGYKAFTRKVIIKSGLTKLYRMVRADIAGTGPPST
jgi:hypothetical protein